MNSSVRSEINQWYQEYLFSSAFVRRYPYYAHILSKMIALDDPSVGIMAVSMSARDFLLHVNVKFFQKSPRFLPGVLLHEVHHVVLGHLSHPRFSGVEYPNLLEVAMEMSANEHIKESLPGEPILWKNFCDFGIREGQSTLKRYELLVEGRKKGMYLPLSIKLVEGKHHPRGIGRIYPQNAVKSGLSPIMVQHRVEELIVSALGEADQYINTTPGVKGTLAGKKPGKMLEELGEVVEKPETYMDWKAALEIFLTRYRAPEHVYSRPNRRFPHKIGMIPGRRYSSLQSHRPNLLIVIDTSGSMSSRDLGEIARHFQILKGLAKMTIVECDVVIHRVYPFEGKLCSVMGRGGTDLRPPFHKKFLKGHRADGLVYFTDGCGPYPQEEPPVKTLWVLTKDYEFSCPWGEKAVLKKKEMEKEGTTLRRRLK